MSGGMSAGPTSSASRGRLRVYLAIAPGAGKTYAMLAEAKHLAEQGVDVVVGLVETHDRADTEAMLAALEQIPPAQTPYRGSTFAELDVDKVLARHPAVVLVDELAHTCVPGSRHEKRWEDVHELLTAGIDVITALNVQHIDSLNDAIEAVTGIAQHETVPDAVVAAADEIEFLDITPEQLRTRIADTDVLRPSAAPHALTGFYTAERLAALRELASGWLQQRSQLGPAAPVAPSHASAAGASQRVVVALTGDPEGEHVLRRAAQIATSVGAELIGVHVREPSGLVEAEPAWLTGQRRLLGELGGHYTELAGIDVATAVIDFARNENAHQLVIGRNPTVPPSGVAARLGHQQGDPNRRAGRGSRHPRPPTTPAKTSDQADRPVAAAGPASWAAPADGLAPRGHRARGDHTRSHAVSRSARAYRRTAVQSARGALRRAAGRGSACAAGHRHCRRAVRLFLHSAAAHPASH